MLGGQGLLAILVMTVICVSVSQADDPKPYEPAGMWAWDFWFAKSEGVYHAFYLQSPKCVGDRAKRFEYQHVGHASSRDLLHWTDHGPVVIALRDTWNDFSIATGSVAFYNGKWWMLFTGHGRVPGIGLAQSDDLMQWHRVGDGPVVPLGKSFEGTWKGERLTWRGVADPYVYPEPVDGWYYLVLNSQVEGVPVEVSGCLTTMRSQDMVNWEPHGVVAYPGNIERLETPQIWRHGGTWYLYFGAAHDHEIPERWTQEAPEGAVKHGRRINCVWKAECFEGPFEPPAGQWWYELPDGQWGYIYKFLEDPDGREVMLTALNAERLSFPYPVSYGPDGLPRLGMPQVR